MNSKIIDFIEKNALTGGAGGVLVAFSGGADSSALLDFFIQNADRLGLKVAAAHFNHRIRGEEADRDEEFCASVCRERGTEFFRGEGDVPKLSRESGISLEMAARRLRYEFLEGCAAKLGYLLATAHNADDNLETMLLNLCRGTGTRGMSGIPPRRGNIIRPMLCVTKKEILAYCESNGIKYVTDSTNNEDDCARNLLRHNVLPLLREQNGAVESAALRTALLLRDDDEYLCEKSEELLAAAQKAAKLPDAYLCAELAAAPKALLGRAVRGIFERCGVFGSFGDVTELESLIAAGSGHRTLCGVRFDACKGILTIAGEAAEIEPQSLKIGDNTVGGRKITLELTERLEKVNITHYKTSLNYDIIKGNLVVGGRQPGDRFTGSGGSGKPLKKLFNELGIPLARRGGVLVIRDDGGPLFVEGIGADRRAAPKVGCRALRIIIEGEMQL